MRASRVLTVHTYFARPCFPLLSEVAGVLASEPFEEYALLMGLVPDLCAEDVSLGFAELVKLDPCSSAVLTCHTFVAACGLVP